MNIVPRMILSLKSVSLLLSLLLFSTHTGRPKAEKEMLY